MRRVITWSCLGLAAILLLVAGSGIFALRRWPEQVVPRLPLRICLLVGALTDRNGAHLIAERLCQSASVDLVLSEFAASPRRCRRALELLGPKCDQLPDRLSAAVDPLTNDPEPGIRRAARGCFSSFSLAQLWSRRALEGKALPVPTTAIGPGRWIPSPEAAAALNCSAFLGAGYDHRGPSRYKPFLASLLATLLGTQDARGRFAADDRDHAMIAMTLCEAYAMSNDPALKSPAQGGLDWILRDEDSGPEARWARNTDVFVFDLWAMKCGQSAELGTALPRCDAWRRSVPGFGTTWAANGIESTNSPGRAAALRAVCCCYLGDTPGLAAIPAADFADASDPDELTAYLRSLGAFCRDGKTFEAANIPIRDRLVEGQLWGTDAPLRGCFSPRGDPAEHAMRLLQFEFYYR
ncbi:MAG: hypothetical protein H0W72_14640 [Planctomycetes bacterium]|nr:hypothetical protein [Planctomycetota bacterium]